MKNIGKVLKFILNCFFIFLSLQGLISQTKKDSLSKTSYEYLFNAFYSTEKNNLKEVYSDQIIKKAKIERDSSTLIGGYFLKSYMYNDKRVLKYSDSIIFLSKNKSDYNYPAAAYIVKALHFNNQKKLKKGLDNFILALEYSQKHDNIDFINQCYYYMGNIKYKLGDSDDALTLFKKSYDFLNRSKDKDREVYLNSIFSLAVIFNQLNKLDSAQYYNEQGLDLSKQYKNNLYETYFVFNKGVSEYKKNNFLKAERILKNSVSSLEKIKDFENLGMAYFYLGSTYKKLNKEELYIQSFKKVDTLYKKTKEANPKFRDAYKGLIEHYKQKENLTAQSQYLTSLIAIDSVIHDNEVYLNKGIIKKFEIPQLIEERNQVIRSIRKKDSLKKIMLVILTIILIFSCGGYIFQLRKKKLYKKRFLQIVDINEKNKKPAKDESKKNPKDSNVESIGISDDIVKMILEKLEAFEKNNEFIQSDLTITQLAKIIGTNSKYLSRVIKHKKQKTFINYINALRIDYVINRLKNDGNYRKYTLLAIANEIGFKKTESFSKAFMKTTGITPSFFIKELNKKS